jgi:putative Ca2+/H+ antiporter (TMEM165/GDT1 family)
VIVGAVFGMILCLLLATMTDKYIQGAVWGLILGAIAGPLVLGWPPHRTTSD